MGKIFDELVESTIDARREVFRTRSALSSVHRRMHRATNHIIMSSLFAIAIIVANSITGHDMERYWFCLMFLEGAVTRWVIGGVVSDVQTTVTSA
jgi:hypothetical protein